MAQGPARPLALHQVTAMDLSVPELLRAAADTGCAAISVFTNCPDVILPGQTRKLEFPTVRASQLDEIAAIMADTGVGISGVEYFPIFQDVDLQSYTAGLALGAQLGGSRAVTHIHETDHSRAVDTIGRLCELASAEGLRLCVEFAAMTRGCPDLASAARLVDAVGRDDFAIGIDCLHLVRSGGTAALLAALEPRHFGHAQICDGHGLDRMDVYMDEIRNREVPGRGDFPLHDILSAMPSATPIEVEVPSQQYRDAGVSARDHIAQCVAAARGIVDGLAPAR